MMDGNDPRAYIPISTLRKIARKRFGGLERKLGDSLFGYGGFFPYDGGGSQDEGNAGTPCLAIETNADDIVLEDLSGCIQKEA